MRALRRRYASLIQDANKALTAPIVAVTDKKTLMPPSGDKHDYFSLSPYWWPDSTKPNGLPYIRRDGVTNPESKRDLDQPRVPRWARTFKRWRWRITSAATRDMRARAAAQVRAWFLDSATKMNPHLRFSQLVRGIDQERGSGIIDTRWFIETGRCDRLLQGSKSWTAADQRGMEAWFRAYLTWLRSTPNGKHEHDALNNHGSWYAAQAATYAIFVGDTATARELVNEATTRIGWQITPEGDQPKELERTRSMHYSAFNIEALSRVAEIGRRLGIDLWHYRAPEGGSLQIAIDHVVKFAGDPKKVARSADHAGRPCRHGDSSPPSDHGVRRSEVSRCVERSSEEDRRLGSECVALPGVETMRSSRAHCRVITSDAIDFPSGGSNGEIPSLTLVMTIAATAVAQRTPERFHLEGGRRRDSNERREVSAARVIAR
jgi:hypothetical protein